MTALPLIIRDRTRPGRREDVRKVWEKHMAPAIASNPGHSAYVLAGPPQVTALTPVWSKS